MGGIRRSTSVNRYVPVSMIVDVGEAWTPPNPYSLAGPKDWRPPLSRVIFHETIHYWQYIGHTHLIRLVEEDWGRLRHFDKTREILPPGALRRGFSQRKPEIGFSTQDLVEAHARFWDVQALGPPLLIELELDAPNRDVGEILTRAHYERLKAEGKIWHHYDQDGQGVGYSSLSFDLAMRLAAGRYALPYLELLEKTNDLIAAALFPLCVHFALHSREPADFYLALVARLAGQVGLERGRAIEQAWRALYVDVWREAELLHCELYGCEFFTGQAEIHESLLYQEHPGYRMAHTMLALACDHIQKNRPPQFLVGPVEMPAAMRALWTLDYLLGCCGMTVSRSPDLLAFTAPPVIRFAEGRSWKIGEIFDQLPYQSSAPCTVAQPPPRAGLAQALLEVDEKWNEMLLAGL
ncbi:hypothetical protein [Geoalkalibacter halelectricus]|uniref:Uncharacterized protein n=1 Tax=Geoalkalibacter halelectricus TaxID=2847045 RepID=A0ABY5ZGX3_9BACT|nr:hypothetical protein [Geoalkalibacter halelectricus]MDO3376639.1 hypothetical protein [Geoalkalibacter halelectricus]UWZ78403.1 hypothetical protein L9S41_11985 [Geoalkalibacter halelectricus]